VTWRNFPPLTRKERERFVREEAKVYASNQRPNEDPDLPGPYNDCTQSKYRRHRIVAGSHGAVCEFCGKPEKECLR